MPFAEDACLSESALLDFVEGRLTGTAQAAAEAHIDRCADCRELVAQLARAQPTTEGAVETDAGDDIGRTLGRYQLVSLLGEGGMGRVFEAVDAQLDRKVALKLVRPTTLEPPHQATARLLREAQALAAVKHPNVVSVFDVGASEDGDVYVVMELIDGVSADVYCKGRPFADVLGVFLQAGRGLAAVHGAGLVHRDFKPQNIIVTADGVARLADFGVARRMSSPGEALGLRVGSGTVGAAGTPAYMSPEQRQGATVDGRSDQYSFCMALRETLKPPVTAGAEVEQLIARGLSADPRARFESMAELLGSLERAASAPRRRRIAAGLAVGFALLAAAGGWGALELRAPSALELGRDALFRHQLNTARDKLNEASGLNPGDGEPHYYLAWLHWWFQDRTRAHASLHAASTLQPTAQYVDELDGLNALIDGDFGRADEKFEAQLKVTPDRIDAHYGAFEAEFHHGEPDRAMKHYRQIALQRPDFGLAMDHAFDTYASRGDAEGLAWVLEHPAVKGQAYFRVREVRASVARRDLQRAREGALEALALAPAGGAGLEYTDQFNLELAQVEALRGDLAAAAKALHDGGPAWARWGLKVAAGRPLTDVTEFLPPGREVTREWAPVWAEALLLTLPAAEPEVLDRLDLPLQPALYEQSRYALGRLMLDDAHGRELAGFTRHPSLEVQAVAAALSAEREGRVDDALKAWRAALAAQAGSSYALIEAYRLAALGRRAQRPAVVIEGCDDVIAPRIFRWSWAAAVRPCLAWSVEALRATGREIEAAARQRQLDALVIP